MLLAERCSVEAKLVHGEVVPERHVLAALGHSVRRITVKLRNVELLQVLHLLHIIGDIECTSLSFLVTVNASVQRPHPQSLGSFRQSPEPHRLG